MADPVPAHPLASSSELPAFSAMAPRSVWKLAGGLMPVIVVWIFLVGWLAWLLWSRTLAGVENDQANIREWISEARIFRKTLPELITDYLNLLETSDPADEPVVRKREEIEEQLRALADPTRIYMGQLPMFPEISSFEVRFPEESKIQPIRWISPVPRPRGQSSGGLRELRYDRIARSDGKRISANFYCDYRVHAWNYRQKDEESRQTLGWILGGVVLLGGLFAFRWVSLYLRRERQIEIQRLESEQAENLLLRAEKERDRLTLEASRQEGRAREAELEASRQNNRAQEADRARLELQSQLYAGISIMAGSYAHNIKNLLVRPNDLLSRCLESEHLHREQSSMLHEVQSTLGTVTERLQQILKTIRRDPGQSETTLVDLNDLVREMKQTWSGMAEEKWKVRLRVSLWAEPLRFLGDLSHLQQSMENLLFNARDATFEMRNVVREEARTLGDSEQRKKALLVAASWKGEVLLTTRREGEYAILEVKDNGIGMTAEVRERCTQTHFSTKRDNALFAGLTAGMGLGLSFVTVVMEHHGAVLEIDSEPRRGATFRAKFALLREEDSVSGH